MGGNASSEENQIFVHIKVALCIAAFLKNDFLEEHIPIRLFFILCLTPPACVGLEEIVV